MRKRRKAPPADKDMKMRRMSIPIRDSILFGRDLTYMHTQTAAKAQSQAPTHTQTQTKAVTERERQRRACLDELLVLWCVCVARFRDALVCVLRGADVARGIATLLWLSSEVSGLRVRARV